MQYFALTVLTDGSRLSYASLNACGVLDGYLKAVNIARVT